MRSRSSRDLREGAGARIKRLNHSGLADRDMDQTGRRIEKRGVGASGDLPLMRDGAGIAVDFDHGRVVACHVKTTRRVIEIEAVRPAGRKPPVLDVGQLGNKIIEGSRIARNTRSPAASVTHQRGRPGSWIENSRPPSRRSA